MESTDDSALLHRYVEGASDEAFAALVTRYVNLVYSVALRDVGNPHRAEEVTQAVFIVFAKKAAQLRHHKALSTWLFQATHLTANNFVRSEIRRRQREQEAHMKSISTESGSSIWETIAPLLDSAVAGLNEKDRRAIVLRFYEGRNLREVGVALDASEEAAKKRVNRALEKLRQFFLKRGVVVPAAVLMAAISANSVHAAPSVLAQTATAAALAKGAVAPASIVALAKGSLKLLAWANVKTAVIIGAAVVLAAGTSGFIVQSQFKSGQNFPASAWAFDGYGNPTSSVKTLMWAISRNDARTIYTSVSPACQAELQQVAAGFKPPMSVEQFLLKDWTGKVRHVSGFRIFKSEVLSDNEVWLNLSVTIQGESGDTWVALKKIDGQWKFDDFDLQSTLNGRTGWRVASPKYGGVGIKLRVDEQTRNVCIKEVIPNSPASRAGISTGLVVKAINGVSTARKSAAECIFLTRGLVNRNVWLVLVNPERNETNIVELAREDSVP